MPKCVNEEKLTEKNNMKANNHEILTFGELVEKHAIDHRVTYVRKMTTRFVPISIGGLSHPVIKDHISDQTRPRFVIRMENSTVDFKGAIVKNNLNEIVKSGLIEHQHEDHAPWFWRQRYQNIDLLQPNERVVGNTLYLSTIWWNSYYHFQVDVMGKLFVLLSCCSLDEFDHIIFAGNPSKYMLEIFATLGLIEKIRIEPSVPMMYSKLTIPSYCANGDGYIPADLVHFLQKSVGKNIPVRPKSKIYISRKNAGTRRVINEDAVETFLMKYGFKTLFLEQMTVLEQLTEFANATDVIAPHGAGLTNLIYAQEGTRVLEFFSGQYVNKCYAELSGESKLEYYYAVFEKNPESPDDIMVDLKILDEFLQQ